MKDLSEIVACVLDYGSFIGLADMMGRKCKTFYYSPFETEYLDINRCCIGDGMEHFERVSEVRGPRVLRQG